MMAQHTPGPWTIRRTSDYPPHNCHVVYEETHDRTRGVCDRATYADARLIAAAPEMLALIDRMLHEYQRREWTDPVAGPAADARALLAKIEGKETPA